MLLIPKIYLKNGKAVAVEGTTSPLFQEDANALVESLLQLGFQNFHIVDLSVPHVGASPHIDLLKKWTGQGCRLTVSGNIVAVISLDQYFDAGVSLVALQSAAYQQPQLLEEACKAYPEKISAHIDVKAKKIVIPGWTVVATKTAYDYADRFLDVGVKTVFYSDVDAQGNISQENLKSTFEFCQDSLLRVFLTSEIARPEEIHQLTRLGAPRLSGLILNKAFYQGKIDLTAALTQVADITQEMGTEPTLIDED